VCARPDRRAVCGDELAAGDEAFWDRMSRTVTCLGDVRAAWSLWTASFGFGEVDRREVSHLVLCEGEPDTVLDVLDGADRNGDPLLAP